MLVLPTGKRLTQLQRSPKTAHILKNVALLLLSLILLPLDTGILLLSYVARRFRHRSPRRQIRQSPTFRPRAILVTGVGMDKGLFLARTFYEAGHEVIGADFEPDGVLVRGRVSCALRKFYRVSAPDGTAGASAYISDLLAIVRREGIDLWVSCAGQSTELEDAQAKEVIERRTSCKVVQLDAGLIETVHPKDSFVRYVASLGLNVPETHLVTSRGAIHKILDHSRVGRYIIKPDGIDNARRGELTALPHSSRSRTYSYVASLDVSPANPWVLQEFVRGKEYCSHALVVRNEVKAFVACPSTQLLMHYEALPADSALNRALLEFNQEFATRSKGEMTGHLALDFMVRELPSAKGVETTIYPIECNPRAHTAVLLFDGLSVELSNAYLAALSPGAPNGAVNGYEPHVVTPNESLKFFWAGHDLVTSFCLPLLDCLLGRVPARQLLHDFSVVMRHLLFWKEGTYTVWDPLPWWWLYHVYWPGKFLMSIRHGRPWSQLNVSTVRTFEI